MDVDDTLVLILDKLDIRSLVAARAVCRRMHDLSTICLLNRFEGTAMEYFTAVRYRFKSRIPPKLFFTYLRSEINSKTLLPAYKCGRCGSLRYAIAACDCHMKKSCPKVRIEKAFYGPSIVVIFFLFSKFLSKALK